MLKMKQSQVNRDGRAPSCTVGKLCTHSPSLHSLGPDPGQLVGPRITCLIIVSARIVQRFNGVPSTKHCSNDASDSFSLAFMQEIG